MLPAKKLLLLSNSVVHGTGYLDHAAGEIADCLRPLDRVLFIPFALRDHQAYFRKARERFSRMGLSLESLHESPDPRGSIGAAPAIFVGGGNTFRLLSALHRWGVVEPIRRRVAGGMPYVGSSAGSIVACPTLMTTKDMPIVEPPTFTALGLVEFQISPHYLDPDPASTHMGETQEERIVQFLEENDRPVAGLREGAMLRVEDERVTLSGGAGGRIFRRGSEPVEVSPGDDLTGLLARVPS
jgi:dipeptidase E